MTERDQTDEPKPGHIFLPVYATAALCVILSLIGFSALRESERVRLDRDFEQLARSQGLALRGAMARGLGALAGLGTVYSLAPNPNRLAFRALAEPLTGAHPGLRELLWAPRVTASGRRAYEEEARNDGRAGFRIVERTGDGRIVTAGRRPIYFPVQAAKSGEEHRAIPGLDLAAEPAMREALWRARDTGRPAASRRSRLDPDLNGAGDGAGEGASDDNRDGRLGFHVVQPVYRAASRHDTIALRRTNLVGFVVARFDFRELADAAANRLFAAGRFDVLLVDGSATAGDWPIRIPFAVADQDWTVLLRQAAGQSPAGDWRAWATLFGGLAFSAAISLLLLRALRRAGEIERVVKQRSQEVLEANARMKIEIVERERAEEWLALLQHQNELILNSAGEGIFGLNPAGRITFVNPAAAKMTGWASESLIGRSAHTLLHHTKADGSARLPEECRFHAAIKDGEVQHVDDELFWRKDGSSFPVDYVSTPIRDDSDGITGAVVVLRDIGQRKEAEARVAQTRAQLQEAIDAISEGFVLFDADDKLVLCNSRYREIYAETRELIVPGVSFEEIVRSGARRGQYQAAIGNIEEWVAERLRQHRNPQGAIEQHLANGTWLKIAERKTQDGGTVGIRTDITELKQREQEVRESGLVQAAMLESALDCIITINHEGKIIEFNPAAQSAFGYTRDEAIGRTLASTIVPEAYREEHLAGLARFLKSGEARIIGKRSELPAMRRDGSVFPTEMAISSFDVNGKPVFTAYLRDISERRQAQAALIEAKDEADAANRAKSEFLATMSHEIRTPMNGVIGMAGLLLDTKLDQEQRRYVETVRESGEALLTLLNDILDFSKLEAGKLDLETLDFDLGHLIDSVTRLLAPRAHGKGIELGAFIAPTIPACLSGDPSRLRQILINLVGNAIKFTETGGISIEVGVHGGEVEPGTDARDMLIFTVTDTGSGIPSHVQEGLFDKFTQADASTTRRFGGTGLGLAICRQLVNLMAGEIGIDSAMGRGSTFWFTARLGPASRQTRPRFGGGEGLSSLRVLVVDDSEISRRIACKQFESWNMPVEVAEDGRSAIEAMAKAETGGAPFDLVLIDQLMPTMNGQELGRRIRRQRRFDDAKLVLMSTAGGRVAKAGKDIFATTLAKPVLQSALLDCIANLFEGRVEPIAQQTDEDHADDKSAPSARLMPLRILLAEDNQVNQMVAIAMLTKEGFRVDVVGNGLEAVGSVSEFPYDLVLMDVQMPEMDGVEATQKIRNLPGDASSIPIIAMTANAMKGDREKYLEAGMDDYVSKPVDKIKLMAAITRQCGTKPTESAAKTPEAELTPKKREISGDALAALEDLSQSIETLGQEIVGSADEPTPAAKKKPRNKSRRATA